MQDQARDLGIDKYYMNFIVSLAKIPGGLFAAICLNWFPRRPVFLLSSFLVIAAHVTMGLTTMGQLPSVFAILSVGIIQFASTAGYISVAGLLLGSLLPSSTRSIFVGIILTIETLSALSQGSVESFIDETVRDSVLFFVFAGVVTVCFTYMLFLMPETKGLALEEIEHVFLYKRQKGCPVRRDPRRIVHYLCDPAPDPAQLLFNKEATSSDIEGSGGGDIMGDEEYAEELGWMRLARERRESTAIAVRGMRNSSKL